MSNHGSTIKHSSFDNVRAAELITGHDIVERNEKGRITSRETITEVNVSPSGCWGHVHVSTKGGKQWCYDADARLEMD